MPRRSARSVARDVLASAGRLSDDLLALEERTFVDLELLFFLSGPAAQKVLELRMRGDQVRQLDDPRSLSSALTTILQAGLSPADSYVRTLLEQAADMALTAIGTELRMIESRLTSKHRGVAQAGVDHARQFRDRLITEAMTGYMVAARQALAVFAYDAEGQVMLSSSLDEPVSYLARRLFSPDQANLNGLSGRGVWWRPLSSMKVAARAVEFNVVNLLREAAMVGLNEAARGR